MLRSRPQRRQQGPSTDRGRSQGNLVATILQPGSAANLAEAGQITLNGDRAQLETYAALLDEFDPNFPIVAPRNVRRI